MAAVAIDTIGQTWGCKIRYRRFIFRVAVQRIVIDVACLASLDSQISVFLEALRGGGWVGVTEVVGGQMATGASNSRITAPFMGRGLQFLGSYPQG
jgi:hypothetical protein